MAARRRDVMRNLSASVAKLRDEGDHTLADQVERFMQGMPPVDSERRTMQRALVKQLKKRQQDRDQDKEKDMAK